MALSCLLHAGVIGGAISLQSWLSPVAPRLIPIELVSEPNIELPRKIERPKVIKTPAPVVKTIPSDATPPAPKASEPPRPQPTPVADPQPPPTPKLEPIAMPQAPAVTLPQMKAIPDEAAKTAGQGVSTVQESRAIASPTGAVESSSSTPTSPIAKAGEGAISLREALADSRLAVRSQTVPRYPESARRAGVQGTTLLKVHVLATGQIGEVQIEESGGHPSLDQAARDAVRRWKFEPGKENGRPVSLWVLIPFEFRLK